MSVRMGDSACASVVSVISRKLFLGWRLQILWRGDGCAVRAAEQIGCRRIIGKK
jgi:hypothetical protein